MLSLLATIHVKKEVEIIWYANLDREDACTVLTGPEKDFCRRAIAAAKGLMVGQGPVESFACLGKIEKGPEETSWERFCKRIDVCVGDLP